MGCNCKKKYNAMKKYADNKEEIEKEELNQNIINKVATFFLQIIFGVVASCILILIIVPMMIYVSICLILGKEAYIKIINPQRFFRKKD